MTDRIRVEAFEIDLQDLVTGRQVGEDEWVHEPVRVADLVVDRAARIIVDKVKDHDLTKIKDRLMGELLKEHVQARLVTILDQPMRKTNDWGEPIGAAVTVKEMIDAEIKRQLTYSAGRNSYNNSKSVLEQVIEANVNQRLMEDLKAAFVSARKVMIDAAAEAGKKAMAAAVEKAFS